MGSKYSNGAKSYSWCALCSHDSICMRPNVKAPLRLCDLLSRTSLGCLSILSVSDAWAADTEVTAVFQGQRGWTLNYMFFKPILFLGIHWTIDVSLQLRNVLLQSQHGPHTELVVVLNQSKNYFRFSWEEVPHIQRLHPEWNTFSPVTFSRWLINCLYFTTEGERFHIDDLRGTWHAWVGNDLFWRHVRISDLIWHARISLCC